MALLTRLSSILLLALLVCYIDLGEASKDVPVARAEDTHLSQDAINALWENWHPSRERMDLIQNETNSAPSDLRYGLQFQIFIPKGCSFQRLTPIKCTR